MPPLYQIPARSRLPDGGFAIQNAMLRRYPEVTNVKPFTTHEVREQCLFDERFGDQVRDILAAAWKIWFCVASAIQFACKLGG